MGEKSNTANAINGTNIINMMDGTNATNTTNATNNNHWGDNTHCQTEKEAISTIDLSKK